MGRNVVKVSLAEFSHSKIIIRVTHAASDKFLRLITKSPTWRAEPPSLDFAAIALTHYASALDSNLHIEGRMSQSQARNLERFADIWSVWCPKLYRKIDVTADSWTQTPARAPGDRAVMAFSGGVDATFSLIAHNSGMLSAAMPKVGLGVLVSGADLDTFERDGHSEAYRKVSETLESFGARAAFVSTNWKTDFCPDWGYGHTSMIAGILNTFSPDYETGIIASDADYLEELSVGPYGNHMATNHLLGSSDFSIIQGGGAYRRSERVQAICKHDVALKNLWVCYALKEKGRNCGQCKKCIYTRMAIRAYASEPPMLFDAELTDANVDAMKLGLHGQIYLNDVLRELPRSNPYYATLSKVRDREGARYSRADHQRTIDELASVAKRLRKLEDAPCHRVKLFLKKAMRSLSPNGVGHRIER